MLVNCGGAKGSDIIALSDAVRASVREKFGEIMNVLTKYRLEPKRMQLVYPYIDREPNMVLIEALKGGNSRVTVEPPLIVYKEPGVYTENILKIYDMI